MEVAARLSSPLLAHLRRTLGERNVVIAASGWGDLAVIVRQRPIDVAVIDPRADAGTDLGSLHALLAQFPALPVVLYTTLSPETMRTTVELAHHGVRAVVLRGFDDEPRRFREMLERLPAQRLGERALASIAGELSVGMPLLQQALRRMYESPHLIQGVESLARASGMTRRNLDRWLAKQGLASARVLIFTARLAQAYHYLGQPGYMLDDITKKLGYASSRRFARQVRATMGMTPSVLRERVSSERFVERLAAMMRRRGANDDGAVP